MKQVISLSLFFLVISLSIFAQVDTSAQPFVKKYFVIVQSTTDYATAKATAVYAAKEMGFRLDLRGLEPNKQSGLTFSEGDCENEGGYPCYIARGRYDNGYYVSIGWSDAYEGFAKGYYVVIVASGDKKSTKNAIIKAKKIYGTAYRRVADVYVGCMH